MNPSLLTLYFQYQPDELVLALITILLNDKLDPMESKNLAKQYPERVKEMKAAFYQWIKAKPKPLAWGGKYQVLTESAKP
ncbi:protein of unknown function [Moritella yayanosii]|uniref:Uncharacterized protein n=1 Tax=Moritella yayanosii TaxID=69539 RepID=A0A330LUK4_9GAMM|nr:protein of unknown function [Moritella yayanosii]